MPYVRVWIHLIWSTKNREPMLERELRARVFDHIKVNAKDKNIYLDTIDGYTEHVHTLISLGSDQTIGKVAQLLKGESSHWVNQNSLTRMKFEWQDEYIAISVSESMVENVREYIRGQEEHHRKKSFAEEYQQLLQKHGFTIEGLKSP
ncbi:MAG: IS200/IS605 family transposase [Bacteroidota bacterium]